MLYLEAVRHSIQITKHERIDKFHLFDFTFTQLRLLTCAIRQAGSEKWSDHYDGAIEKCQDR